MRGAVLAGAASLPPTKRPDASVTVERLLANAIRLALADAGLKPSDVNGLGVSSFALFPDRSIDLAMKMGFRLTWTMDEVISMTMFQHAVHAIEQGAADVIVLVGGDALMREDFRRMAESYNRTTAENLTPLPAFGPNAPFALVTQAHMAHYGLTREDYGRVVQSQRRWAGTNPLALYRTELTMSEYLNAPMVADPLTIFDCPPLVAGAEAVVMTSTDRDKGASVRVLSLGGSFNHDNQLGPGWPTGIATFADELWKAAGVGPSDIDLVELYDDYPVIVLAQLQDLGFIKDGDASQLLDPTRKGFVPVNTGGGILTFGQAGSGGSIHCLVEGVKQLRGQRPESGIENPEFGVVAGYGMALYRYAANSIATVLQAPTGAR
jgi:acetyl-CoA acetyltransferase